jgi:hypothetical protein
MNFGTDFYAVAGVAALIIILVVVFSVWSRRFGLRAIERWATGKGWSLVYARRRTFVPHWRAFSNRRFQFFRVTLRDKDGADHRAWMRLESDCSEPEVLDVIWDDKTPAT